MLIGLITVERTQRPPSSKISNLIHDAESKGKKKSSMENLSLVKRESPLGGEDNSVIAKSDDLSNAPKLPPKPGKPYIEIPKLFFEGFKTNLEKLDRFSRIFRRFMRICRRFFANFSAFFREFFNDFFEIFPRFFF